MLPLLLVSALMNPLFNHEGATIITYFKSGNPLTLESIVYGISAAVMIIGIIEWFSCFNEIMTSDKIIYLFGKIIPSMSLIISMSLRFVPMFKSELKEIIKAQKCIGRDISKGPPIKRAKRAINVLSQMITRALENAVDTADSMKSRGFGLEGRTSFSNFDFTLRDKIAMLYILVLGIFIIVGNCFNIISFKYFPSISFCGFNTFSISIYFSYFMLCFLLFVIIGQTNTYQYVCKITLIKIWRDPTFLQHNHYDIY